MSSRSIEDLNKVVYLSSAASDFVHVAKLIAATRGKWSDMQELAKTVPSARVREVVKAGVAAISMSDAAALVPYREIATGFAASTAPWSSYDRIYNDNAFMRTPLKTGISIASTAATGSSVSELAAKPICEVSFTRATLEPVKVWSAIVSNEELARSISAAAITRLGDELRRACALSTDRSFLATLAACTGVASNASTGLSTTQFLADLDTALQAVSIGANSKLYLILPPNVCKTVALLRDTGGLLFPGMTVSGGVIQGVKVVVSDAAEDTGTLVDASQVATESDLITLAPADHASIQMDDDPTSGATTLVSLWQNNLTGLSAERWFGVEVLRSTAVALITGMGATA